MLPPLEMVPSDTSLPARVDAAVIGGGIVGVAAAFFLAKKGRTVALLEKGRIGAEQSGRNWGWCRRQNRDRRELPLMTHSMELWDSLPGAMGTDVGFRRSGLIYVTKSQAELAEWEAWIAMAREFQVHSRILSATEAKAMTPGNEQDWIGGVHSPHDGRAEPSLAAPALASAARAEGATIHQDCVVRRRRMVVHAVPPPRR
jgi:glycine/D-amino acid oxidase-like deaminating enzyme